MSTVNLTIGIILPNVTSSNSQYLWTAIQAIDDINVQNLIPGAKINYEYFDSELKQVLTVKGGITIINSPNRANSPLIGIVGEYYSSRSAPLNLVCANYDILQCSISSAPILSDKTTYPTYYRLFPSDNLQGIAVGDFIVKMGWSQVAIISENGAYGFGLSQTFLNFAQQHNIEVLGHDQYLSGQPQADYAAIAGNMKTIGARIFLFFGYDTDTVLYFREAAKVGLVSDIHFYIGTDAVATLTSSLLTEPGDGDNVKGLYAVSPLQRSDNAVWSALNSKFQAQFGESAGLAPGGYYDCGLSMAYAVNNYLSRTNLKITDYSAQPLTNRVTFQDAVATKFLGASGEFSIDENGDPTGSTSAITTFDDKAKSTEIGVISVATKEITFSVEPYFRDGTTNPPKGSAGEITVGFSDIGPMIFFVISMILAAVNLFSIGLIFWKRNERTIKALSPVLLIYILVGLTLASFSIFGFMGPLTPGICLFQQWGLWIAFTIVFGALFFKILRIWKIFDSKNKVNKIFVKTAGLVVMSASLVVVEVIVLAIWSVVDPLTPVRVQGSGFFFYECQTADPANALKFTAILLIYNAFILFSILYLAFKSRNVKSEFRESSWIAQMSANITLCSVVTLLTIYIVKSIQSKFYIRMVAVAFGISITHFCLVGRLFFNLFSSSSAQKGNGSSNIGQISSPGGAEEARKIALYMGTVTAKEAGSFTQVWKKRNIFITNKNMILHTLINSNDTVNQADIVKINGEGICYDLSLASIRDDGDKLFTIISASKSLIVEAENQNEKKKILTCIEKQQPFSLPKTSKKSGFFISS